MAAPVLSIVADSGTYTMDTADLESVDTRIDQFRDLAKALTGLAADPTNSIISNRVDRLVNTLVNVDEVVTQS